MSNRDTRCARISEPWPPVASNEGTSLGQRPHLGAPGPLFDRLHAQLRTELEAVHRHGVMIFASSTDLGLVGQLWLEATDALRGGTVGRHSSADLSLPWLETLSLRHLLLLVRRVGRQVHLRAIDLRSGLGFCDERGEAMTGLDADGPLVLWVSGWWLYVFPTGGAAPWNPKAASPWQTLPERLFTQRRLHAGAARQLVLVPLQRERATLVSGRAGPVAMNGGALLGEGERPQGLLHVACAGAHAAVAVGRQALARGVLLGRDPRCDAAGVLVDSNISRVHALLLQDEHDGLCLFDVGSTNGTWSGQTSRRMTSIEPGAPWSLAHGAATLWWEPAQ